MREKKSSAIKIDRRELLKGSATAMAAFLAGGGGSAMAQSLESENSSIYKYKPAPQQVPVREGICPLEEGAGLYYWDTGGSGPAVVFCHPATGSALTWEYQQPVFAQAGFRVIAYSRRGRHKSPVGDLNSTGTYAGDLDALIKYLNIEAFHIVGVAAGGFTVSDYICSFPEKILSMTVACSLFGGWDTEIRRMLSVVRPDGFSSLPPDFREIGPSYRAAHPEGVREWLEIERESRKLGHGLRQNALSDINWQKLRALDAPKLLMTGGADLYQPPSALRAAAERIPEARTLIVPEIGHALYWERPDIFNSEILKFIS